MLHRPWRRGSDAALLIPVRPVTNPSQVSAALRAATSDGFRRAYSPALAPSATVPWYAAGFEKNEDLCLLVLDISAATHPPVVEPGPSHGGRRVKTRRATRLDSRWVLDVDHRAFVDPFWHLDRAALRQALEATSKVRFRVGGPRRAYAIAGVESDAAFLQRLAVDPTSQRTGLATALVQDAISWSRRMGARSISVNTQANNEAALQFYTRLGFRLEPGGLVVLRWESR